MSTNKTSGKATKARKNDPDLVNVNSSGYGVSNVYKQRPSEKKHSTTIATTTISPKPKKSSMRKPPCPNGCPTYLDLMPRYEMELAYRERSHLTKSLDEKDAIIGDQEKKIQKLEDKLAMGKVKMALEYQRGFEAGKRFLVTTSSSEEEEYEEIPKKKKRKKTVIIRLPATETLNLDEIQENDRHLGCGGK